MDIGQPPLDTIVIVSELFVVQAQEVQHRGMKVIDRADILNGPAAEFIRSSITHATFHSGAQHPDRESVRIMIASQRSGLMSRLPPEFGCPE